MADLYVRIHLFLARHRAAVLLLMLLFFAGAVLASRRLRLNEDYSDMLPMSNQTIAEQVQALKQIRQAERLFFDVQSLSADSELLAQAADRLHEKLSSIPELADIRYSFGGTDAQEIYDEIQERLPALFSAAGLRELESRLEPAALQNRLAWFKKALTQPQGLTLQGIAASDPAGLADAALLRLRALQAGVGDARIVAGRITSSDGRHVLITAQPAFKSSELGRSRALIGAVLRQARDVETEFGSDKVRVAVTGAHRVALDNATMIQNDAVRTSAIATFAVAVLLLLSYRRRWLSFLALAPTVVGALGALLIFSLTGEPVSAIALGFGSILVGVTVDYGLYVLYHADDERPATRELLARGVAVLAPALFFGALTSMAAFLMMLVSPVPGHRQLGAFGAVGILLAAIFALVVVPLFVPTRGAATARRLPLTGMMERLFAFRDRHQRTVLPLLAALSAVSVLGVVKLRFDGDLARFNGVTAETGRDEQTVREVWGKALSLTTVLVSGATLEEARQKNESLFTRLETLQGQGAVESFSSIAPLLPSARTAAANVAKWRDFWNAPRMAAVSNALAAASSELGFRLEAFAPFLERISSPPGAPSDPVPADSALGRVLGEYCSERDGRHYISTLVKVQDRAAYQQLRRAVGEQIPDALLLNKAALGDEITRVARRGLPVFAVLIVGLNALLFFLFWGRLELMFITLLPMGAGVFWTLGVMGLIGLPIDISNFIFVIFVLGVVGDYSLFLLMAEVEPLRGYAPRAAATGGAVSLSALTTLFGVGVLALARHPALFSIGITALLGISLSLLATLFLVPTCMGRLRRHFEALTRATPGTGATARRQQVQLLYRYHEPYVMQFVYWKMKTDPLFAALDRAVPAQARILDLGCGYGIVAHWLTLAHPNRTVLGIDNDEEKIRIAQMTARYNSRVAFQRERLPGRAGDAVFDCVLLCDVLHYFPRQLKLEVLRQAFAALASGGRLVLRDACATGSLRHRLVDWAERWAVRTGQNQTAHGLHFESLETHLALLRESGFEGIETLEDAGLGSNLMLVAMKAGEFPLPSCPSPAASAVDA